ncbi:ComEC/Rec2 family competence protein [Rhodovarius crocodyli]|uniref:ComEC/Rec2 family competence protein n=1 Tax=Rhodovarius crocodyli TaxID=1979269 RepID=UPI001F0B9850|nr:ComEC/Rec2 family competence protein [Rhodovarius crocodyli]
MLGYFALDREPPLWLGLGGMAPVGLALWLAPRRPGAAWLLGLLGAAWLGFALAGLHSARMPGALELPRTAVRAEGVVTLVEPLPEGLRVTLSGATWPGQADPAARLIRVRLKADDPLRPEPGQRLAVRSMLRAPSAPTHPGAWDFQRAAWFTGLGASGYALGRAEVLPGQGSAPALAGTRRAMEARIAAALPGAAGAVSAALITGGQSAIPPQAMAAMRDSGLAHLLSVSGLHMTIVVGLVYAVLRGGLALWPWLALRLDVKLPAALGALAAGGFYLVLSGNQIPMLRSFAMAALVTAALLAGRRAITLRGVAIAALVVLLLDPSAILGPSFQMSFAAVLALVAAHEWWRPRAKVPENPRWWRRPALILAGMLMTSLIAGLATMPFGLAHFGRLQLYGVAANMLAVPVTSFLVMPAGLVAALAMPLGLEGVPLAVMGWGVELILAIARAVASWPGATMAAEPLPAWGAALAALGLCWLALWRGRLRAPGLPMLALGLMAGALTPSPHALVSADGRLVALRAGGDVFVHRHGSASRFVQDAWLRSWAEDAARPMPGIGGPPGLACDEAGCRLAERIALLRPAAPAPRGRQRAAAPEAPCGRAALIISPEPVRGDCAGSRVIDRFSVWRDGAHAVWLSADGGVRVVSDRAHRGDRPWVPPRPSPRYQADSLPVASIE